MGKGTVIDATIINAPGSRKNKRRERDAEMHSSRKRNRWFFGMKAHIGVDKDSGVIHSVVSTAGNVHDLTPASELLDGGEDVSGHGRWRQCSPNDGPALFDHPRHYAASCRSATASPPWPAPSRNHVLHSGSFSIPATPYAGIHDRSFLQHRNCFRQMLLDGLEQHRAQSMTLQQKAAVQNGSLSGTFSSGWR